MLNLLGAGIDGLSVNMYYDSEPPEQALRGIPKMEQYIDQLRSDVNARAQQLGKNLAVMIGEHAHVIDQDFSTNPPTKFDPDLPMQWQGAITTADFLMMTSKKNIERAHFFIWGNGIADWHPIRYEGVNGQGNQVMKVLPLAKVYDVLGDLVEDNALDVSAINLAGNASDDLSYSVRAGAFKSDDGSILRLFLINRDPSLLRNVDILAISGYSLFDITQLTASGALAESVDVNHLLFAAGQSSFALPSYSITVLEYHAVPEPAMLAVFPLLILLRRAGKPDSIASIARAAQACERE